MAGFEQQANTKVCHSGKLVMEDAADALSDVLWFWPISEHGLAEELSIQGCIRGSNGYWDCVAGSCVLWIPEMFLTTVQTLSEVSNC